MIRETVCSRLSPSRRSPTRWIRPAAAAAFEGALNRTGPHRVDTDHRLDRPDQHRRGFPVGTRDHVQTVVHAVDKVHVGVSGRSKHRGCAAGPSGARMGRPVLRAAIGLDLHDPADALRRPGSLTDQERSEQRLSSRQGPRGECFPGEDRSGSSGTGQVRQEAKIEVTSEGMIPPKNMSTIGTRLFRVMSAVTEPWNASKIWRTNGNSLGCAICP